jgi:LmbE family N-acetylglucosaminyl deacetylase
MKKNISNQKTVLLFSAHPDDHVCCSGTLMLLKEKGYELVEIVSTQGEMGTWWEKKKKKSNFDRRELVQVRQKELSKASRLIGIDKTINLGLPDSRVQKTPEIVEKVLSIIRAEKPRIIITHNPNDYHSDHIETSRFVLEGAQRAGWTCWPEMGESYQTPIFLYMEGFYLGKPHLVVDVTAFQKKKQKLLSVYGSQIYQNERDLLNSINNYRSFALRDLEAHSAEAFELPEHFPLKFSQLLQLNE